MLLLQESTELLEVLPTPGRYAMFAFLALGLTVLVIFYFMKRSLARAKQHYENS
jgi:hypothetical protein